jgi:hypothetical protein
VQRDRIETESERRRKWEGDILDHKALIHGADLSVLAFPFAEKFL